MLRNPSLSLNHTSLLLHTLEMLLADEDQGHRMGMESRTQAQTHTAPLRRLNFL